MAANWGDPKTDSYRKKHVKEARTAGTVALVNAEIVDVFCRFIEGLSELHVELPEVLVSWDLDGSPAQRLGLALHLPIPAARPHADDIEQLAAAWGFEGHLLDGRDDVVEFRFAGTPAQGAKINDVAVAHRLDILEHDDVAGPSPVPWPGSRDLVLGDTGADVAFLRLVLNIGDPAAPVDKALVDRVKLFQEQRGAPVDGLIDVDLWRRILPLRRPSVQQGDTGMLVRVIQAALIAYEGAETKVTGAWGLLTSRDISRLQDEYRMPRRTAVRDPEWSILLGPIPARVLEAQRVAMGQGQGDKTASAASEPETTHSPT